MQSAADAILLQETKTKEAGLGELKGKARKNGWRTTASPAADGAANSASGGVAVMVRTCFGLRDLPGTEIEGNENRGVLAETTLLGGTVLISAYLRHSEGPSPCNKQLIDQLTASILSAGPNWILAMDANMEPDLLRTTGWEKAVGGTIFSSGQPTCNSSNYDYFLVSNSLRHNVHCVQKATDAGTNPHAACRILLRANDTRRRRRIPKKCPRVPGTLPVGPPTQQMQDCIANGTVPPALDPVPDDVSRLDCRNKSRPPKRPIPRADVPDDQRSVDEAADDWTSSARAYWSNLLGYSLGSSDQAEFKWAATAPNREYDRAFPQLATASTWRSTGRRNSG